MRILTVLTYYRPHTSGLTIYAERLAKALARRGHQVTVLTSQYEHSLPREEQMDGVRIVRAPVLWRVSKGVIMPTLGLLATRLVLSHDVVHLHLPQFDAAGIALRGRLFRKPTVITYHCDLRMPPGLVAWLANRAVLVMNELAALFTHRIVTYTQDYADHSTYLRRHMRKLHIIPPPVELPVVTSQSIQEFRRRFNPAGYRPIIGMAARFATEKGVEVLLDALPRILAVYPQAQVHFAGPYQNIVGEEQYFRRLAPRIETLQTQGHWRFLGVLSPEEMARFYPNIDVLVLPSLNSTEAFGLVQIEAMMNGVPCVASDLPGVRQPVLKHRMGRIVPVGDSHALAEAILDVLANREQFSVDREAIRQQYHPDAIAVHFESLFQTMWDELH
ncbi:glycosyltransferase family 4 protein [uncultured Thermanaerothrix sp.]|uniref:glycosyltransferase family 4 protein n=1 Tax=uncultured Thermanaerothrix sp. TaxID=1195149 RepID=UPI0026039736|nr:glycosyltransferase family 4 protein [uncultured Thermanaerothrix sp.]